MESNWFKDIIRQIFLWLDLIIYKFIDWVYQLFMLISETGIFKTQDMRAFANRIYFFLGLIMIFKVSISIVQYIVNPDAVKDKKVGASKLLSNTAIILVGIVLVPYVFDAAYAIQRVVLKDNIIGNLILGKSFAKGNENEDYIEKAGKAMAFTTFTAFFKLDNTIVTEDSGGEPLFNNECASNPIRDGVVNESEGACSEAAASVLTTFIGKNQNFPAAYENNDVNYINKIDFNYTIEDTEDEDIYIFDYSLIISSVAGGFVVWILLGFCIDIAIRNVKLGFLQLIAPIPLISKVDPKKGDEVFNKWVKECTSTYLSLFGRLIAIYFVIYLLSLISTDTFNLVDGTKGTSNPLVKVFFILGTLQFAKEMPKLIETLTGIKLGDGKGLGLKSKIAATPLIGGATNKALGLAGRTGMNLAKGLGKGALVGIGAGGKKFGKFLGGKIAPIYNNSAMGQMHAQRVLDGTDIRSRLNNARGAVVSIGNTVKTGMKTAGQKIDKFSGGAFSAAGQQIGNSFENIGVDAQGTFNGMGASIMSQLGLLESRKTQIQNRQAAGKIEKEQNKKLADSISAMESLATQRIKDGAAGDISMRYNTEKTRIDMMKNMSSTEWNSTNNAFSRDADGNSMTQVEAIAKAQLALDNWMRSNDSNGAISQYIDSVVKHRYTDANGIEVDVPSHLNSEGKTEYAWSDGTMEKGLYENYCAQSKANGKEAKNDAKSMHSVLASMKTRNNEIDRDQMDGNNKISKIDDQIRAAQEFKSKK